MTGGSRSTIGSAESAGRPLSPLDREQVALIEVGHTDVDPRTARAMVLWFVLTLAALPIVEWLGQPAAGAGVASSPSPWSHLTTLGDRIDRRLAAVNLETPAAGAWQRLVAANRAVLAGFNAFERALEDQSGVGRQLRPRTQLALSGWLGAGNERVYVGRDGWLFYRPDVEYVTGPGFLDERAQARRMAAASEYETVPAPDPRPAIRQFQQDLAARGVALVIVPTPVKPTVHPGQLIDGAGAAAQPPTENASYAGFVDEMRRDGVLVFDPSAAILGADAAGGARYLATDTHWRPETMEQVAEALATFVRGHVELSAVSAPGYGAERREARQQGDTAAMLDLPRGQTLYPPERVALRFVVDGQGNPWRPSREADVLVLGDSFSNIYSLASMGWGESAGLVEQLSYTLQRPVDRIVQNDDGAYATRALLQREVGTAGDRLTGKRVVVWQFAARELAIGDWRVRPPADAGRR